MNILFKMANKQEKNEIFIQNHAYLYDVTSSLEYFQFLSGGTLVVIIQIKKPDFIV